MSSAPNDLLDRFREGDAEAIRSVSGLARVIVGERGYYVPLSERDDVVQEIVIHAHRAICCSSFEISHSFEALLRTVAHRRCIDWMRRQRKAEPIGAESVQDGENPEESAITHEELDRMREALRELSPSHAKLVELRVREGLDYAEIAERLGRSEHGVRTQMYKCLVKLRSLMEQA